jgi:hypothetical protein
MAYVRAECRVADCHARGARDLTCFLAGSATAGIDSPLKACESMVPIARVSKASVTLDGASESKRLQAGLWTGGQCMSDPCPGLSAYHLKLARLVSQEG